MDTVWWWGDLVVWEVWNVEGLDFGDCVLVWRVGDSEKLGSVGGLEV